MSKNTAMWQGKDKEWAWWAFNGWVVNDTIGAYGWSPEKTEHEINNAHVIIMMCMEQDRGEHTIPTPCYE